MEIFTGTLEACERIEPKSLSQEQAADLAVGLLGRRGFARRDAYGECVVGCRSWILRVETPYGFGPTFEAALVAASVEMNSLPKEHVA